MKRTFALAGLLRLRHLQQDQAAGDLAQANATAQANTARRAAARSTLDRTPTLASGADTLAAIAFARASAHSMLADMEALGRNYQVAVGEAQVAFDTTRADSVRLEKLEGRHGALVTADDLHREQTILDEIASTGWHRNRGADGDPR
ncbi:flagellar export protein FliJ [Cryobacterium sinapicolor]|uniref:Flagellar export protein FliJ n=1 Tax=Cryobacterium sinapicolor TaxID=1259236 RepID=A0ABY2IVR4_9MICO|nr:MULTISPECIES: flagellar export protein FliJ [Cryobacterium]TFC87164.1 flagellar export protein FliJ [Cryobacterium sp. TMT3-29-2]TFC95594.1 flagellar export protein FliJ [Cryobacterium sinapicolor]